MTDTAHVSSRNDRLPELGPSQPAETTDLSIVVVNFNTNHLLKRMVDAVRAAQGDLKIELIIIDNASKESPADLAPTLGPDVRLIYNHENIGFGRANNRALMIVRGNFILLLNTDAFVSPDALAKTVRYMKAHPDCGVLGVTLVSEDGSLQPSCRYFPTPWNDFLQTTGLSRYFPKTKLVDDFSWDHATVRNCDWVPGCYYLIRKEVIDSIGLFDPRFFLYFEEVDHCKAVRSAGWNVTFFPHTKVVHIGGESAKSQGAITKAGRQLSVLQIESKLLFYRKHYGLSGIVAALVLQTLACAVAILKDIVRPRQDRRWQTHGAELRAFLKILRSTRYASVPTR